MLLPMKLSVQEILTLELQLSQAKYVKIFLNNQYI